MHWKVHYKFVSNVRIAHQLAESDKTDDERESGTVVFLTKACALAKNTE